MNPLISKLPVSWSQVTLRQYLELVDTKINTDLDDVLERVAILLDMPSDDPAFEDLSAEEFLVILKKLSWMHHFKDSNVQIPDYQGMKLKAFENIFVGEFIDLDHYLKEGELNMHYICAILFKQCKTDEWGNTVEEPYIYNLAERADLFLDVPVTVAKNLLSRYIDYRNALLEGFTEETPPDDDSEYTKDMNELERREFEKEKQEEIQRAKWAWEHMLWDLSGNDLSRFKEIFEVPIILALNVISMKRTMKI